MTLETVNHHAAGALARHDPGVLPTPAEAVTSAIHAWVSGLDIAMQGADYVVDTPACPDSFWPLPGDTKIWNIPGKNPKLRLPDEDQESFLIRRRIAAQTVGFVVRYGLGLGLAPEVALNGIFVIGGRPSMYAEQMVALIKSQGHGHRVIERSAESCTVAVKHRDETDWEEFTFTMEDAIQAGYVKGKGPNAGKNEWGKENKGGNEKYTTNPKTMLYARASSIACKTKFPDVLRGMVTYEEVQDERSAEPAQQEERPAAPAPTRAAAILARTAQAGPQDPDPTPSARNDVLLAPVMPGDFVNGSFAPDAPEPEPADPEPLAPKTWDAINRRFVELEVIGDGQKWQRLAVISHIIGRTVIRGAEMTAAEGQLVLDNLSFEVVQRGLGRAETDFAEAEHERLNNPLDNPPGEYDPTTEPSWGQHIDGADAGGEA